MQKRISIVMLSLIALATVSMGCNHRPVFGPQGPIGFQQSRSLVHDPFPSNDLGPPISGMRPLGFDQPRSEPTSLQQSPYARKQFQGAPYGTPNGF